MHAILVHGWRGWPENAWFPWLRQELERRHWTIDVPTMPEPMVPDPDAWVATLERTIFKAAENGIPPAKIVLVGHSLGCPTILMALERHEGRPFAKVVLVSGFARAFGAPVLQPWMQRRINLKLVRSKARRWAVLHGTSDPFVPIAEGEWMAKHLGVLLTRTEWPGHFMHEEGVTRLPEALNAVVSFGG